jgi:hypothetical protein
LKLSTKQAHLLGIKTIRKKSELPSVFWRISVKPAIKNKK